MYTSTTISRYLAKTSVDPIIFRQRMVRFTCLLDMTVFGLIFNTGLMTRVPDPAWCFGTFEMLEWVQCAY